MSSCDESAKEDSSMTSATPAPTRKRHRAAPPPHLPSSSESDYSATERTKKAKVVADEVPESDFETPVIPLPMTKASGTIAVRPDSSTLVTKLAGVRLMPEASQPLEAEETLEGESLAEKFPTLSPLKRKGGRPRKTPAKTPRKRGRPKKAPPSFSPPPPTIPSPPPPQSLSPPPAPSAPDNYTLPPLLLHESLIPTLTILVDSAMSYYVEILAPTNPMARYLPENPRAWQTFVATPFFQRPLGKLEKALISMGVAIGDGNEKSVDVKTACKEMCQHLWGAILQTNSGGEEVRVQGFLKRFRGDENGGKQEKAVVNGEAGNEKEGDIVDAGKQEEEVIIGEEKDKGGEAMGE
jgi:hypothetical protein